MPWRYCGPHDCSRPAQLNVGNTANPTDAVTSFINSALKAEGYNVTTSAPALVTAYPNSTCQQTCAAYCKVMRYRSLARPALQRP